LRGLSIPSPVSYLPLSNWIWYPSNANYSHFLLDAFVQMAMAQELLSSDYLRGFELPLDVDAPVWQDELLQKLIFPRCMLPVGNSLSQYQIFRVNKLLLPIISSKAFGLDWLRVFLAKSFQPTHGFSFRGDQSKLIMVTRHDARRERIQNISSIEEMVLNFGGKVIDASSLSCSEKLDVFQSCLICIAESSGCMNPALFAPEYTQLFALTDPSVIASKYALVGAWPYFTGYAHRAQFVGGENGMFLPGSTVGSSSYSVDAIKKLVLEFL